MGIVQTINQIEPKVHINGAVIKILKDASRFEQLFTAYVRENCPEDNLFSRLNTTLQRPVRSIHINNVNIPSNDYLIPDEANLYLVIASGSKHGFNQPFRDFLHNFSSYLEDTHFFINCDDWFDEYIIREGVLTIKTIQVSDVITNYDEDPEIVYYRKSYPDKKEQLYDFILVKCADFIRSHESLQETEIIEPGSGDDGDWFSTEEYREMISILDRALSIKQTDWKAYFYRGWFLYYLGKAKEALDSLSTALAQTEEFVKPRYLPEDQQKLYLLIAEACCYLGQYEDALPYLNKLNTPRSYCCKGNVLIKLGSYEEALSILNQVIPHEDSERYDIGTALFYKAKIYAAQDDRQTARHYLQFSIELWDIFEKITARDDDLKNLL